MITQQEKCDNYLRRAKIHIYNDEIEAAQELLRKILDHDPDHPEAHYNLARIAVAQKDYMRALLHTQDQAKTERATFRIHFNLGILYFQSQLDYRKACYHLEIAEFLLTADVSPGQVFNLYLVMGTLYHLFGNVDSAWKAFMKAKIYEPNHHFVSKSLGILSHQMGRNLLPVPQSS